MEDSRPQALPSHWPTMFCQMHALEVATLCIMYVDELQAQVLGHCQLGPMHGH